MEGEQHQYELRSRSRSRSQTPLIVASPVVQLDCLEHHYDLRNKSRERSHTPSEVTSSRRSGSRSLSGSAVKQTEHSMETIVEKKEENNMESNAQNQNKQTDSSTSIVTKKTERRSERQRAKRQIFANGQGDQKEDVALPKPEQKKKRSTQSNRILTSDYSSEEGDREDPPSRPGSAYEIYKNAGEWWNVFPKTDYTYSQASQYRYEIAPGVLAMPNMSRRSIHSDGSSTISSVPSTSQQNLSQSSQRTESGLGDTMDTVDTNETGRTSRNDSLLQHTCRSDSVARSMIYKTTHVEQYSRHREIIYTDLENVQDFHKRHFSHGDAADRPVRSYNYERAMQAESDTELDAALSSAVLKQDQRSRIIQWVYSFTSFFSSCFTKSLEFLKLKTTERKGFYPSYNYRRYHDTESRWSKMWRPIDRLIQYMYFLLVRVIFLDTFLLSHISGLRRWIKERSKGPKILWAIFLPLLLLTGCWYIISFLPTARVVVEVTKEIPLPETQSQSRESTAHILPNDNNFNVLLESLNERIKLLENRNTYQTDYQSNVTGVLDDFKEKGNNMWDHYDTKLKELETKLDKNNAIINENHELSAIKFELQTLKDLYSQMKSCCDTCTGVLANENIEKQIQHVLSGYFGKMVTKEDLTQVVENLKLSLAEQDRTVSSKHESTKGDMTEEHLRQIVKEMIKVYDADKTGLVDYALESAGGQIISTRCTQRYDIKSRAYKLLGFTLYHESNDPRTVIQGNAIQPGACWAFQDFPGYLLIKLRGFIHVTGFTIEHAPRSILPNGEMKSAPRKFNVWGLKDESDSDPVLFGDYEFVNSDDNLQYFPVQNKMITRPFEYVELRVHSNHGQLEYTCLYRFRVHGKLA